MRNCQRTAFCYGEVRNMGFSFNGTPSADVSIDGDVTLGINQKIKTLYSRASTNGTITIGTVPANKVWYVLGWTISQGGNVTVKMTLNAVDISYFEATTLNCQTHTYGNIPGAYIGGPLTSGQVIERTNNAAVYTSITVYYVEVSV